MAFHVVMELSSRLPCAFVDDKRGPFDRGCANCGDVGSRTSTPLRTSSHMFLDEKQVSHPVRNMDLSHGYSYKPDHTAITCFDPSGTVGRTLEDS